MRKIKHGTTFLALHSSPQYVSHSKVIELDFGKAGVFAFGGARDAVRLLYETMEYGLYRRLLIN